MRTIERSSAFRRDYKRAAKGRHATELDTVLMLIVSTLCGDRPLDLRYRDHALSGD